MSQWQRHWKCTNVILKCPKDNVIQNVPMIFNVYSSIIILMPLPSTFRLFAMLCFSFADLLSTFFSSASRFIACSVRISFKTLAIEIFSPGSHYASPLPRNTLRAPTVGNRCKVATLLAYFLAREAHKHFLTLLCTLANICSWLARPSSSVSGSSMVFWKSIRSPVSGNVWLWV